MLWDNRRLLSTLPTHRTFYSCAVVAEAEEPTVVEAEADEPTVVEVEADEPTVVEAEADEPTVVEVEADVLTVVVAVADVLTGAGGINAVTIAAIPPITAIAPITGAVNIGANVVSLTGVMGIPIIMAA
jgi:hypothetical protein